MASKKIKRLLQEAARSDAAYTNADHADRRAAHEDVVRTYRLARAEAERIGLPHGQFHERYIAACDEAEARAQQEAGLGG